MKKISIKELILPVIYNVVLLIFIVISYKYNYFLTIKKYILFNTSTFLFKDFLSIVITILTMLLGAMLTVSTVLISMCDKRLINLIRTFEKITYLKSTITKCMLYGFSSILLYAAIYVQFDFRILSLRLILLYIATTLSIFFINKSILIVYVVIKLLGDSLENNDGIKIYPEFKKPLDTTKSKDKK